MIEPTVDELLLRANHAMDQGDHGEAIALFRRIVDLDPAESTARNNLGCLLLDEHRLEEAVEVLTTDTASVDRNLQNTVAYALLEAGDLRRAEQLLEHVLGECADDPVARNHLGMLRLRDGQESSALSEFLRVTREWPQLVAGWNNLGTAYRRRGELDNARSTFEHALTIDPYSVDAHNNLGCVLRELGRAHEAIEELRVAIQLEPEQAQIHLNLALCFQEVGDDRRALTHLRSHLEKIRSRPSPEVVALKKQLEKTAPPPRKEPPRA